MAAAIVESRVVRTVTSPVVTLHDHVKELRNRFFSVALFFVVVSAVAYNFKEFLIEYLLKPLGDEKLIYLNPAGGFSFIFQVTMYAGLAVTVPLLVYNLYRFVAPALPARAQKHSALVILSSLFLLCIGVAFGYFIAIPGALTFLNSFADGYVIPSLTADSYLNFVLAYTAGLGILFQLPLVLMLVHWVHPLKPGGLLKFERWMILIAFVAAAMITPTPDIMNQLVIALPIIVMYQIGFIAIVISIARAKQVEKKAARSPKLSRAERKAQKNLQPKPIGRAEMPVLSDFDNLVSSMIASSPQPALPVASVKKPAAKIHVMDMVAQNPSTKPQQQSPLGRSMDIMMSPIYTAQKERALQRPAARPGVHRTLPLQVPPRHPGRRPSIDGISMLKVQA